MAATQRTAERLLELVTTQREVLASNAQLALILNVSTRAVKAALATLRLDGLVDVEYPRAASGDLSGRVIRVRGNQ